MKLFKWVFAAILLITFSAVPAQEANYNLPPGYYLNPHKQILDFSFKLDGIVLGKEFTKEDIGILQELNEEDYKKASPEYKRYVKKGEKYINSLSPRVRSLYTDLELWYIYAFDQKLKEKLSKIK